MRRLGASPPDEHALADALPSWRAFAEAQPALEEARRRGWKLGVLSNTDDDYIAASQVQLGVRFDEVIVAQEIGSYKPAHKHWEEFYARTHAPREGHVHVAASLFHDVAPCNELGIRVIWINRLGESAPEHARPTRELSDLFSLPDALDDSLRLRHAEDADAQAVAALVTALDIALLGASDYTLADLHEEWRGIAHDDRWVVVDGDAVVGYGTIELNGQHGQTDGYVHPASFGRGVGTLLVQRLEEALADRGQTRVQNAVLGADARAHALLRTQGYEEIRRFWQMRIELDSAAAGAVVAGRRRGFGLRSGGRRSIPLGARGGVRRPLAARPGAVRQVVRGDDRPARLRAPALDGGADGRRDRGGHRVRAGAARRSVDRQALHRTAVASPRSRRGAPARVVRPFWREGKRTIGLGVDAQSDTGAHRLYERVGMHVHWGAVIFEKTL